MKHRIEQTPYPTRYGLPVPISEVDIPTTLLKGEENNHHNCWESRRMSQFCILQTLRDLQVYQERMDYNQHTALHQTYSEPNISIESAYDRVHEAFDAHEMRRLGSAACFELLPLSGALMQRVDDEYKGLRHLL